MRATASLIAGILLFTSACEPAPEPTDRPPAEPDEADVRAELLVSVSWLAEQVEEPVVMVVHVGPVRSEYETGHIPGARFLGVAELETERDGIPGQLPEPDQLRQIWERVGLEEGSRVILCGSPLSVARAFVSLDVLGLGDRAAILEGGIEGWRAAGHPVATGAPPEVRTSLQVSPRPDLVADAEWVAEHAVAPGVVLVDARPRQEYNGQVVGEDMARGGHIPGAVNLFWEETLESVERTALRDPGSLRSLFRTAGVTSGDTVVAYSRAGMQSSFIYFVARYLGHEARLYDGSFHEWSRRDDLPVTSLIQEQEQ